MDGFTLTLYLVATFLGGLTSGLAGFALGLVVSGIWLHILTPIETAILIVGYGLFTQGYGIWKLRHALNWKAAAPFILGSAAGVPVGAFLVAHANPAYVRTGIGVLLIVYSVYSLARPAFKIARSAPPLDVAIGVMNGVLGGLTGLAGIVVVVWCQLRGLAKDAQRTIFQPVLFASLAMSAVWLAVAGAVTLETAKLYALGLPVLLAGTWSGIALYGKLDDAAFRKIILVLLLLSGAALIVPLH